MTTVSGSSHGQKRHSQKPTVYTTRVTLVHRRTLAIPSTDQIQTSSWRMTRLWITLVDFLLTKIAGETCRANTNKLPVSLVDASSTVHTWKRETLVYVGLAKSARVQCVQKLLVRLRNLVIFQWNENEGRAGKAILKISIFFAENYSENLQIGPNWESRTNIFERTSVA